APILREEPPPRRRSRGGRFEPPALEPGALASHQWTGSSLPLPYMHIAIIMARRQLRCVTSASRERDVAKTCERFRYGSDGGSVSCDTTLHKRGRCSGPFRWAPDR